MRGVLESLALKYAVVLRRLEEIAGFTVETIHVVGGGARNALLNQFTANACGCRVAAGPVEATVLGNLLLQARSRGELSSLEQIRDASRATGGLEFYEPGPGTPDGTPPRCDLRRFLRPRIDKFLASLPTDRPFYLNLSLLFLKCAPIAT